jgi:aminopeptidase Y
MAPLKQTLLGLTLLTPALTSVLPNQLPLLSTTADTHKPLVDTEALQSAINITSLLSRASTLFSLAQLSRHDYNHPTRVIGSAGHTATLEYIYSELAQLGDYYTLSEQPFPAFSGNVVESRLVLGDEVVVNASAMSLTPATKGREPVFAEVVLADHEGCDEKDFSDEAKGKIVLIKRGTCGFGVKSKNAGRAGAVAAVIYNSESGPLHGTMGQPDEDHVATFGISKEEAEPFVKRLSKGKKLDGIAYIDATVETIHTRNIIAQTTSGDPENCVVLGAHSDSVTEGPGINDDGSGTLSLLEVATHLSKYSVNNCVRFAWWAGEEEGLLGSDFYAASLSAQENKKIRLFMDYDMMASPNFAYQIYNATNAANPVGSEELRELYVDWYEAKGLNYTFIPFDGRSDYDGFIRAGIPAGGIATGAEGIKSKKEEGMFGGKKGDWYDPCYHQLCDDVGNVNATAWEVNTKLIAHSVATYAVSLKDFPERKIDVIGTEAVKMGLYEKETRYHGTKLFI